MSKEKIKREKIIKIRVSAEEHEQLKFNSTKVQLAEWMRESCLNVGQVDLVSAAQSIDPVDPALLRALSGIGNNLNQIARKVNTSVWGPSDTTQIIAAMMTIEKELSELRKTFR
jgi:hypothetical protein